MSKRYEFEGTHYTNSADIFAAEDSINSIVMYVNQERIHDGAIDTLENDILSWLATDATVSDKYSLVDWCNSFGDPVFEESDEINSLPDDSDLAEVVAQLITEEYNNASGEEFYIDGNEYINMEIFNKANEI